MVSLEADPDRAWRSNGTISVLLEAVGALTQGGIAVVLGALARLLGSGVHAAPQAAGMTWMSRLCDGLAARSGHNAALGFALVGFLLVGVRGCSTAVVAALEVRASARAATSARLRLLEAALAGTLPGRISMGEAVTWPNEIEQGVRGLRSRRRAFAQLTVLFVVSFALDPLLAAIVLGSLVPFALLLRPIRRALRRAHAHAAEGAVEMIDATRDVVEHAAVWAACGGGPTATRRVRALSTQGASLSVRAAAGQAIASSSNEVLAALAIVVLVAAFAPGASHARPALVPVLVALMSAYRPLRDLAEASGALGRAQHARKALDSLAQISTSRTEPTIAWPLASLSLRSLAVDVGSDVARAGIDANVAPGEALALVGTPGTGKSALLETMVGVRRSSAGALLYGEVALDARAVGPNERPIAWVPPSPPVLPGSLAENLAPDAPDDRARIERARAVLRELGDSTMASLPDDAMLGPRGRRPSSGEAQRLALARAIASDAPVLVLDEPTASLDAAGEKLAIETLARHGERRVTIFVTHRPAPLSLATRVISLDPRAPSSGIVGAPESERRIA